MTFRLWRCLLAKATQLSTSETLSYNMFQFYNKVVNLRDKFLSAVTSSSHISLVLMHVDDFIFTKRSIGIHLKVVGKCN